MAKEKPNMNVVFVGHVDHGKSTTVGRLFYDSGAVSGGTVCRVSHRPAEPDSLYQSGSAGLRPSPRNARN